MPLARAFFNINERGVRRGPSKVAELTNYVLCERDSACSRIRQQVAPNFSAVIPQAGGKGKKTKTPKGVLNLSSTEQIKEVLNTLGMKVPRELACHDSALHRARHHRSD